MTESPEAALHDAYAADYDQQVRAFGSFIAEALFGLCYEDLQPGQLLLDLGIGSGLSAVLFTRAGLRVYGMDFSPAMLEICRAKGIAEDLKLHDLGKFPWPYPDRSFDHLVCCGVFHFIPELEGVFSEAVRVLRGGGLFAFTTKAPANLDEPPQKYEQRTAEGLEVYAHSPAYVAAVIEHSHFEHRKVLKCFVGEDLFYVWTVQRQ